MKAEIYTYRTGFYVSILLVLITIISFAVVVPPISGPFCPGPCINYPFTEILTRFPREYIWMYTSILIMLFYIVQAVCIHRYTTAGKRTFSLIGLSFAIISATVLMIDYFIQVSVIQPSLLNGETEGIAILTQYNPHGIFIALEELGYIIMSFSFLFIAPVFYKTSKPGNTIFLTFLISFILVIISFGFISIKYGINREYIFECVVIVIDWLVLIINGVLLSIVFGKEIKKAHQQS